MLSIQAVEGEGSGQPSEPQPTPSPAPPSHKSGGPPKKVGDEAVHKELGDRVERAATTAISLDAEQYSGGHTPGSDEGRLKQDKLTDELKFQKSKSKRRRLTLVTFEDEEDLVAEDPSKHGRSLIEEMDLDAGISLVPPHDEVQGSIVAQVSTADPEVTTADAELNTASTFVNIASPQRHAYTATDDLTLTETLMEIRKSAAKDKGKAKMDETESPRQMKQREQVQISRDEEVAQKLQEEFDAVER
ncbi:hypothetical protein Tco_1443610 [Tanacetum coccineum]